MKVRFLTLAQQEVDDAVLWFEAKQPGMGVDFLDDPDRSIQLLKTYPFAATEIEPDIRRCLLDRFPYTLIYGIEGETIVVVAVAHMRRDLHYWTDRVC